jgi:surface protein
MDFMFFYCVSLKDTNGLWHWNTAQVLNFNNMFCKANISSVGNLCCWEVQKANSMNQMFFQCNQLTNLAGLEKWDIGCVTNMMGMFAKCSLLFDTSALESWKTKFKDTVHQEKIFADCNEMAIAPSWYSVEA